MQVRWKRERHTDTISVCVFSASYSTDKDHFHITLKAAQMMS